MRSMSSTSHIIAIEEAITKKATGLIELHRPPFQNMPNIPMENDNNMLKLVIRLC